MVRKVALLAATGLIASIACAQAGPPPTPDAVPTAGDQRREPGMERMRAERDARRAEWRQHRAEHEARRESDMALLLDLRPAQRMQLHAFLASMRPQQEAGRDGGLPRGGRDMRPGAANEEETFGARLAERQTAFDVHAREEQARLAAARAFYQALDPHQRDKFEAVERLGRPRHGPGGPMRMARGDGAPRGAGAPPPPPPGE